MKRIKYFGLLSLFLFLGVSTAFGQGRRQGNFSPEQMKERMAQQVTNVIEHLKLEGDKAEQVKGILMAQGDEQMAIMETFTGDRDPQSRRMMREEMAALREDTMTKLGEVLTEEEVAAYQKYQEEQRGRFGRGGKGGKGGTQRVN